MKKVIILMGPTGVGKSEMAIRLAKKFNGEVISADSVAIFKGLDIGSAKLTEKEMQGVKHHCIDICQPNDYFTVYDFVKLTESKIESIAARGKLPIICGGTGLYIKALINGYNFGSTQKNKELRELLAKEIEEKGSETVWNQLYNLSSQMALKIEKNDKKRIIRALEIATAGKEQTMTENVNSFRLYALTRDRERLYHSINARVDKMLASGLIEEVKRLLKQGASTDSQSMKAIGYKEVVDYFKHGDYDKMAELIKQHSRNYAKRQLTFIRGLKDVHYIDVEEKDAFLDLEKDIKAFLKESK